MMETIDRELADIQVIGERMLALVTGVLRALEIYDLGNGTVQSLIRELVEITEEYAGDHGTGLSLLQDGENMFCNQEFLRLDRRVFDLRLRRDLLLGSFYFFGVAEERSRQ